MGAGIPLAGQGPDSLPLWWRIPKEKRSRPLPEALGIAPVNVLPLRRQEWRSKYSEDPSRRSG